MLTTLAARLRRSLPQTIVLRDFSSINLEIVCTSCLRTASAKQAPGSLLSTRVYPQPINYGPSVELCPTAVANFHTVQYHTACEVSTLCFGVFFVTCFGVLFFSPVSEYFYFLCFGVFFFPASEYFFPCFPPKVPLLQ